MHGLMPIASVGGDVYQIILISDERYRPHIDLIDLWRRVTKF